MTKINLVDLDYENIRTSLLEYLKKQDTVKDLNFEGSAVNFLLDLLAYNTLFYAHYANMVSGEAFLDSAQLERSIVSLVKPLGYVLPTRTSAIGRIQLISVTDAATIKPFSVTSLSPIFNLPFNWLYNFILSFFVFSGLTDFQPSSVMNGCSEVKK